MSQVATSRTQRREQLRDVVEQAKQYADRICEHPKKCPMFPIVSDHSGPAEVTSYMQGYLAGLIGSTGKPATKGEMAALRDEFMHHPSVRDIILKTPQSAEIVPPGLDQREF